MPEGVPCFKHVQTQVYLQGLVFFCIIGGFNSITNLTIRQELLDARSSGFGFLYLIFCVGSLVAPPIINLVGSRTSLFFGTLVYPLFSMALLLARLNVLSAGSLEFFAAAVGVGAPFLWAANWSMLASYPTKDLKASYISTFWWMFNLGSVVANLIVFATDLHGGKSPVSSPGSFVVYIVIGCIGSGSVWLLQPLDKVVRVDGTQIEVQPPQTIGSELLGMWNVLKSPSVLALLPLFLYSNWFYSFQLAAFSGNILLPAASSLAGAGYWGAQMIGCKVLALVLDAKSLSVGQRAWRSFLVNTVLIAVSWALGVIANSYYRLDDEPIKNHIDSRIYNYNEVGFIPPLLLMLLWGFCDALTQNWCLWVLSFLFDCPEDFSRVQGVFKFAQSLGSSIGYFATGQFLPTFQLWLNIGLFLCGIPGSAYVCYRLSSKSKTLLQENTLKEEENMAVSGATPLAL